MSQFIDNAIALRILSMLVKPFTNTEAFHLGIIDAQGRNIIPANQLTTQEQKDAYTYLHRLVFNIKKILNKLPGGESRLKNMAAAMLLVKECYAAQTTDVNPALLERVLHRLNEGAVFVQEELLVNEFMSLNEDGIPVNSGAGTGLATGGTIGSFSQGPLATGGVAGIDPKVGPLRRRRLQKFIVPEDLFRRFSGGKSASRPWSDYLDDDNEGHQLIKDFAKKNPNGIIILQNGTQQKAIRFNRSGGGGTRKGKR